jgi:hypothetical protein
MTGSRSTFLITKRYTNCTGLLFSFFGERYGEGLGVGDCLAKFVILEAFIIVILG